MIAIPLTPWETAFGVSLQVWYNKNRLQGVFHVESLSVQDIDRRWSGRVVGLPILSVVLKGRMEWVNPYTTKVERRKRKRYKAGALTPGYVFANWPCSDYRRVSSYRATDVINDLRRVGIGDFVQESRAGHLLDIYGDDEPLPVEFLDRVTYWDGRQWALR